MTNRIRVAVLFGGKSSEHSISCISAGSVLRAIDRTKYEVIPVGITLDGRWVLVGEDNPILVMPASEQPEVIANETSVQLINVDGQPSLEIRDADALVLTPIDVVFPVLHGPYGEDGTIQGLLDLADVPYVGSGVFSSAASMDKAHMKAILRDAGFNVGSYEVVTNAQWVQAQEQTIDRVNQLQYPLFVKPCRAGSSVGITKVHSADQLINAIEIARSHDPKVIVESSLENVREIECGVLGDTSGPRTSVCAEIVVKGEHEFYDFDAKYVDNAVELIVPAHLPLEVQERAQAVAREVFITMDCAGLARVDMFVLDHDIVVNELNTMPGFTPISMFPRMWAHSGIEYPQLIDELITDALHRGIGLH
ncbi:MAG: D-alanine--D-alanine ligase [Actinobacteria bacterium]|nr:D-alanine--D-alanine ligase [Actinomycetota bacterium]